MSGSVIVGNGANRGAGVYLFNSGNTITANVASSSGGGLYLTDGSDARLSGNIVRANIAGWQGGGLYLSDSNATLVNSVIADNQANSAGGGLYVSRSSPCLQHITIACNGEGGGLYVTNGSDVTLTNTILVSHAVGIDVTDGSTATLDGVLWHHTPVTVSRATNASVTVRHQYTGDPSFAPDGYHLTGDSAAIKRGVYTGVTTDIDGDGRPEGCLADIGADEFITAVDCKHICLPLVMYQYQ